MASIKFPKMMAGLVLFAIASAANAATVTFSDFVDDGTSAFFDISKNSVTDNTLSIGRTNFEASTSGLGGAAIANDTITFVITADPGQVITKVSYLESGDGETGSGGIAIASGSMVADAQPASFLTQIFSPSTPQQGWTIGPLEIAVDNKQQIAVSITNSLTAVSFADAASGGTAEIAKTFSELTVTTVPIPPAFGMLGAALVGLATIGVRRRNA